MNGKGPTRTLFHLLLASTIGVTSACSHHSSAPLQQNEPQQSANSRQSTETQEEITNKPVPVVSPDAGYKAKAVEPASHSQSLHSLRQSDHATVKVRGIYVSGRVAAGSRFGELIDLVDRTDLNAMVVDLKNDSGQFIFPSTIPLAGEIGANERPMIANSREWMDRLKDKQIYTIARIVTFKDPYLAVQRPELAIHTKSGNVWTDKRGSAWIDPYNEQVWNFNIAIAKEAAAIGFDEVQFDYVRFPENGKLVDEEVAFQNPKGWSKSQAIEAFLIKMREELKDSAIKVSADVFGLTTSSMNDMGIGQDWTRISANVDAISPMIYPSHYARGVYGIDNPDIEPYLTVRRAINDALFKNGEVLRSTGRAAAIRPWYQAFSASWLQPHQVYGAREVKEQIKAAEEQGVDQFLLWSANCRYPYDSSS